MKLKRALNGVWLAKFASFRVFGGVSQTPCFSYSCWLLGGRMYVSDLASNPLLYLRPKASVKARRIPGSLKGTVAWDFLSKVISPSTQLVPWFAIWSIFEYRFEFAEIFDFQGPSALWATVANLVMHYGPLQRIWLLATGHCGKFRYALWATAENLVICHGPLCGMKLHSKICNNFCAVGNGTGFGYALRP